MTKHQENRKPFKVKAVGPAMLIILSAAIGALSFQFFFGSENLRHKSNEDPRSLQAQSDFDSAEKESSPAIGILRSNETSKSAETTDMIIASQIPGSEMWFEDPILLQEGNSIQFASVPLVSIEWDPTCSNHPLRQFADLSVLAEKGLFLDPKDYFQASRLPLQFSQFWTQENQYYQFGFDWNQDTPQTFSVQAFTSKSKLLSDAVERFDIPEFPEAKAGSSFLLSQTHEYLKKKIKESQSGASVQLGGRVALLQVRERLKGNSTPESFNVSLRNSTVVSVTGETLTCRKSEQVNKALCICPTDKDRQ